MKCFSKKGYLFVALFGLSSFCTIDAQDEVSLDLGADVVSSYVWRGGKAAGLSVQPKLGASYGDLSLTAWGSTDLATGTEGGYKEVDFTLGYSVGGVSLALTDYWWDGEGAHRYFSRAKGTSGHLVEGTLGYSLPGSFPLTASWNTFFLGSGNKDESGDNTFSTYVELSYPFSVKDVELGVAAGFTPWESAVYGTDGFKFTNVMLSAKKGIKFSDSFTLPIFTNVIFNPSVEDVHFVFGINLSVN